MASLASASFDHRMRSFEKYLLRCIITLFVLGNSACLAQVNVGKLQDDPSLRSRKSVRDIAALDYLRKAKALFPFPADNGVLLTGKLFDSSSGIEGQTFTAQSFIDGYLIDRTTPTGTVRIVRTSEGRFKNKGQKPERPELGDLWEPSFDFDPYHAWWTHFEDPIVNVRIRPEKITVDGEECVVIHVTDPLRSAIMTGHGLYRVEDVFIGSSSYLVRKLEYELPTGTETHHPQVIKVTFSNYKSKQDENIPTSIQRYMNGVIVSSATLDSMVSLSAPSIKASLQKKN